MTSLSELAGNALVVRDGEVVHETSRGYADPVAKTPLTAKTRFQIASISKQFAAAAALLLHDAGRLSIEDPIAKWIAGCPRSWEPITIRHLLSNTSGIGHWDNYTDIDHRTRLPFDEVIAAFQRRDPVREPGSGFHYSSPGFSLLACIVEKASDTPYREFLEREIFGPLELHDTFAGNGGDRPDLAVGCDADGPIANTCDLDSAIKGAGDLWSTARDLVAWNRAVAQGRLLSEESWRQSHTPQVFGERVAGDDHHYGFGWGIATMGGHAVRYHTGDNVGFESFSGWFPELSTQVVYLINRDGGFSGLSQERNRELILELLHTG